MSLGPEVSPAPAGTFAPPGVARLQACVSTRSPAFTSSARAGAARKQASMVAHAIARVIDADSFFICMLGSFPSVLFQRLHKVNCGMQRAERADDYEDC